MEIIPKYITALPLVIATNVLLCSQFPTPLHQHEDSWTPPTNPDSIGLEWGAGFCTLTHAWKQTEGNKQRKITGCSCDAGPSLWTWPAGLWCSRVSSELSEGFRAPAPTLQRHTGSDADLLRPASFSSTSFLITSCPVSPTWEPSFRSYSGLNSNTVLGEPCAHQRVHVERREEGVIQAPTGRRPQSLRWLQGGRDLSVRKRATPVPAPQSPVGMRHPHVRWTVSEQARGNHIAARHAETLTRKNPNTAATYTHKLDVIFIFLHGGLGRLRPSWRDTF